MTSEPLKGTAPAPAEDTSTTPANGSERRTVPLATFLAERNAKVEAERLSEQIMETCRQSQDLLKKQAAEIARLDNSNKTLSARVRELEAALQPQSMGLMGAGTPSLLTLGTSLAELGKMAGSSRKPS